jgi:septal ring factor EnvC (AmiA/AmiB activator)
MSQPTSGRYISSAWVLAVLATIAVALASATARDMQDEIHTLQNDVAAGAEIRAGLLEQTRAVHARLERIETKLDRILEAMPRR